MPPVAIRSDRPTWAWACLGLAGSLLVTLGGPRLAGGPVRWWFDSSFGGAGVAVFYAGIVALIVAWLGLGRLAPRPGQLRIVAAAWCLPLFLGPPLFSQDVYSYLAQGTLVHLGLDPYRDVPAVLGHFGHAHVLHAVDPFWRHTTAPYGPLFLTIASWVAAISGSNLVLGVLLLKLTDLLGLGLLARYVPRVAGALGADPARASWWVLLSPLVLLELVSPAHNDLLMVGLLVAGVALALEGRAVLGIAACALAATIKLPAVSAIPFLAVVWARSQPTPAARVRSITASAAVTAAVIAAVSVGTGLGLHWITSSVFSTPEKVRLSITPATALGWSVAQVVPIGARGLESALAVVAFALSVLLGVVLLARARRSSLVRYLGIVLIAATIAGPAAWPWYLCWGLALLAACPEVQSSRALAVTIAASVLAVKADGVLAFPLHTAPAFLALYVVVAWVAFRHRRSAGSHVPVARRWRARALAES